MSIALLTFDIFGTVLDWRTGLSRLTDDQFERAVDRQGVLEQGTWRSYTEIVAQSLVEVAGLNAVVAAGLGAEAGKWPLFADSAQALQKLRGVAPCAAITNSDKSHGDQVQSQLGFRLDGWVCAEETRVYKPDAKMWQAASQKLGVPFSKDWWHVSAYADYDHTAARALGLTCVHVQRPHSRPGPADLVVADLAELASRLPP
jgi:2-haloalkanoic acid dehalogenase type II